MYVPQAVGYTTAGLLLPAARVPLLLFSPSIPIAPPLAQSFLGAYNNLMHYAAYR